MTFTQYEKVRKAILFSPKDNVATALRDLDAGTVVSLSIKESKKDVLLKQAIKFGHKFSIKSINKGASVIKYGEIIGLATKDIPEGYHVHIHNVEGARGRGDKQK